MKNILCIFALAGAFAAQAQPAANSLLHHIPADADKVYQINLGAISAKISWQSVASLIKDHNMGSHGPMKMDDMMSLMNSGIDFHNDAIITTSNADSSTYTTFLLHLTDSGKFATLIRTKAHNVHMLHLAGKDRVAVEKGKAAAWNDHLAVLVMARLPKTDDGNPPAPQLRNRIGRRAIAALHGFTNTPFVTDPRLATAFSDDGDLHIWNRHSGGLGAINKVLGAKGNPQLGALAQLASQTSRHATLGTLRFETGKLTYRNLKLLSPGEKTAMQRISSPELSSELIAAIPPGELMGMMTIHYNMPAWIDSLSRWPLTAMLTSKLKDKDITLQDFSHALKGSFLVLAYAPDKNQAADTGASAKMPLVYLAAAVDDKATFDRLAAAIKLTDAGSTSAETSTNSADTTAKHKNPFRYYAINNGVAVIGASREQVNGFFHHPAAANPAARLLTDRINSNTFTMSLDIHAFADFLTPMLTKADTIPEKNQALLNSLHKLDVLEWSAGALKDDGQESYLELRFTDQDKNALASLMDIFGSLPAKKPQP